MKRFSLLCLLLFGFFCTEAFADEGMWLFKAFPKEKLKAQYGFDPTQAWLDHVRLASVRFNNGGSGSFVSPDGLTITNHHVGAECIQQLSTGGKDFMKTGFYAATPAEEAKCPNLELNQLVGMEDVTAKVNAPVRPGMTSAGAGRAQRAVMSAIEKDCVSSTHLRCDVVTFYSGEVYHLYKYKKYTDVRLVFAPEFDIAFFGGDPDNFTYPRYDLDVTFFRVYENNKPAHIEHYLRWSKNGVHEGDLIFVSGNPGSTGRLKTMSQLEYLRDVDYPARLSLYARRIALLKKFSAASQENTRIAKEDIFGLENSQKAIGGFEGGLQDVKLMARKAAEERQQQTVVDANPQMKKQIGDPWQSIATAMQAQKALYPRFSYLERRRGFYSKLAMIARDLVRATEEKSKPNERRLREYRDSALPSLEANLFSTAPIYKSLEIVTLSDSLAEMQEVLGRDDPAVQKALQGKTAQQAAREVIQGTRLDEISVRKELYRGGTAAIEASTDPLIVMMRSIDTDARATRRQYDDEVDSVERVEGAKIARARFSASGFTQPPDATFTLRLSYGAVKGYTENGRAIPCFTEIGGAYTHAAERKNQPPYQLPESWVKAKNKLKLRTPLDFVSTADIIGGNSGSPTVNKNAEFVGIVFDGNIQSLSWNFVYDDSVGRAVSVDSRAIMETLRKIYGAQGLVKELTGRR